MYRNAWATWMSALLAAWTPAGVFAGDEDGVGRAERTATRSDRGAEEDDWGPSGFWPSRTMTVNFLNRMAEEMAERYDFDDDQIARVKEVFQKRIPKFMSENREAIQTMMNKFFEAQLGEEAPTPEYVAKWAQDALPVMEEFRKVIDANVSDMKEFLTEDQQLQLEAEHAAFTTGMQLAVNKVGHWAEGGYDPQVEWADSWTEQQKKDREERRKMRAQMREAEQKVLNGEDPRVVVEKSVEGAGGASPSDPKAASGVKVASKSEPKDEWTRYVEEFIRKYELGVDQQAAALRSLEKRKQDRLDLLRRNRVEESLNRIEKQLAEAKTEDERKAAKEEFARVNKPIERIFQQLKDDLDKIPTRTQREKAGKSALDAKRGGPAKVADAKDSSKREGPGSP